MTEDTLKISREYLDYINPNKISSCLINRSSSLADDSYDLCIIVPCYNMEKYIKDCMESILSQQTQFSFWVIVVDDGSTDRSLELLSPYFASDNVLVVQKENGGVASARNAALTYAKGKYLLFVDADDMLLPNAIEHALLAARETNADVVEIELSREYIESNTDIKSTRSISLKESSGYVCGKFLRSSLMQEICFPENVWFEDTIIKWLVLNEELHMVHLDEALYYYRPNPEGATAFHPDNSRCIDTLWCTQQVLQELPVRQSSLSNTYLELLYKQIVLNYIRTAGLDEQARYAIFCVTASLYEEFVKVLSIREPLESPFTILDKIFSSKDYETYKTACEGLWKLTLMQQ